MPKPPQNTLPAPEEREFRQMLANALNELERRWADARWGVYAASSRAGNEPGSRAFRQRIWRRGWDLNPRTAETVNTLAGCPIRPLWHLSARHAIWAEGHHPYRILLVENFEVSFDRHLAVDQQNVLRAG